MKADREDGPAFLRQPKKNHLSFIISLITVSAIFWTLTALYGKPIVVDLNMLLGAINPKTPAPAAQTTYQSQLPEFEEIKPNKTAEELFWSNVNEKQQQPKVRQTEFNERNYAPKEAINVVKFEQPTRENEEPQTKKTVKVTVVKQTPSMKDRACWPYKEGSVERRNCRLKIGLEYRDGSGTP